MKRKIFILLIFFLVQILSAQKSPTNFSKKVFTLEELKEYDGKNGKQAYVAVNGVVYDVSDSKYWKGGKHHIHQAGNDLTEEFKKAPKHIHTNKLLENLQKVGILRKDIKTYKIISNEIGKEVICPVMKEKFKISKDTKALIYKNKKYYFCCSECYEKFKQNPEKYIGGTK